MSKQSVVEKQKPKQRKKKTSKKGLYIILAVVLFAILITAMIISLYRPVGDFVKVEKKSWPQANGKVLGNPDARVVVREFADYQCPYCKVFVDKVQQKIIDEYVATGKVRYEFHHFIVIDTNIGGVESRHAAEASECAVDQGLFWDYHEMLFANQKGEGSQTFSDKRLKAFASALEMDTEKFNACFDAESHSDAIDADIKLGKGYKLPGTPALYVNDQFVEDPINYEVIKTAIEAALNGSAQQ